MRARACPTGTAASRKCESTASSQAICATRYWQQLITECAGSSTQRTAADRPRAFACRMHSNLEIRQRSLIRSPPASRIHQELSWGRFACCATRQPRPIADQSVNSLRRQHTGHHDSTVSICDTDRCFSGRESFTSQGTNLWTVAMEPASRLQPTRA